MASINSTTVYQTFQEALFQSFKYGYSYHELETRCGIPWYRLRNAYIKWLNVSNDLIPESPTHICLKLNQPGRPIVLTVSEEKDIARMVTMYAENNTPLAKSCLMDLTAHCISQLPAERQETISFKQGRPSEKWVRLFCERHDLKYQTVQNIERARVAAMTPKNVGRFFAMLNGVMRKYGITSASQIYNIDESKASFGKVLGRSGRKAIGRKDGRGRLIQKIWRVTGARDRVTVMPVVCADGTMMKPVIVFWGKQAHYRRTSNGKYQTLHDVFPNCYLYQREIPGINNNIFQDWTTNFVEKLHCKRTGEEYNLLVFDGYRSHLNFKSLQFLRDNRGIVVALPAHTSHKLQRLDVSVFSPYKWTIQKDIHERSRVSAEMHAFDIGRIIRYALSECCTVRNIRSGFQETGLWNYKLGHAVAIAIPKANLKAEESSREELRQIKCSFEAEAQVLVNDENIVGSGTVKRFARSKGDM